MDEFEYSVTTHKADSFREMVFFCTSAGQCAIDHVPKDQHRVMEDLLNERGLKGWDLVQAVFGTDGMLAIWKRRKTA